MPTNNRHAAPPGLRHADLPLLTGHPATAHWGYPDPSAVDGSEERRIGAFRQTLLQLRHPIDSLINLPPSSLVRLALDDEIRRLART